MPLMDRDITNAIVTILKNVDNNLKNCKAKTDFFILVSGGAPGIGKTQFGEELFNNIQSDWILPVEWIIDGRKPYFEYIYLDFSNDINLKNENCELDSTVIIGLRIAFTFFIKRKYDIVFEAFRALAKLYIKIFNISMVFESIRKSLSLFNNQVLFIFLHIDDFQEIDIWDEKTVNLTNKLFKNMISDLACFIFDLPRLTYIQTFLSETAPQIVIMAKEASKVLFKFVICLLLSTASMIHIVDHYAKIFGTLVFDDDESKWKLCQPFLNLIEDTGGLPRAFQYLLNTCFELEIQKHYNIYNNVQNNKRLALELLYHCIETIPVTIKKCLDPNDPIKTIENLEPYHEAFRTNMLVEKDETKMLLLRDLYRGAYGKNSTLDIVVKLKHLSVCQANEQFPSSKLTNKANNQAID
ncbi:7631_t:CDS:2 [Funneliformis mosseae]|uniref:7631_t:CDS:1 n=1 Tax=Funneliformis mosseae TaxID=27381 RepID=A0A9N9A2X5_FUNMO|nr:7631_t:CDS:2 [Funneliformis mosseae]